MVKQLDLHPASQEERLAAFRNVHEFWGADTPIDDFVAFRLQSPKHRRATWYVGCSDGEVVTSLACYRIQFHLDGDIVDGFSIGSVHTMPSQRRNGFAGQLMNYVEDCRRDAGERIGVLYSDIDPNYYGRLGYVHCPAWVGDGEVPSLKERSDSCGWRLEPFQDTADLNDVADLYLRFHGAAPLAVARSPEYWRYTFQWHSKARCHWLLDPDDAIRGYVRTEVASEALKIVDFALDNPDDELWKRLFGATANLATADALPRISSWIPNVAAARGLFDVQPRQREITMVKSIDPDLQLTDRHIASTDRFCAVDHV